MDKKGLGSSPKFWKRRTSVVVFMEFHRRLLGADSNSHSRRIAEVKSIRYFPICEVTSEVAVTTTNTAPPRVGKIHTMKPTVATGGVCAKEEKWAKSLLGEADYRRPVGLCVYVAHEVTMGLRVLTDNEKQNNAGRHSSHQKSLSKMARDYSRLLLQQRRESQ